MLQHLPGWECTRSKAEGPRLATVTQLVLATTPHSLLSTITHLTPQHPSTLTWRAIPTQCWPPSPTKRWTLGQDSAQSWPLSPTQHWPPPPTQHPNIPASPCILWEAAPPAPGPSSPSQGNARQNQSPNTAIFTPNLSWDWVPLGKPQIWKLLAAPLAATELGNCRAGSRNGDGWNNKMDAWEIKAGVAEDWRHPGTARSPRRPGIHGGSRAGSRELMAPPGPRSHNPRGGLTLIPVGMPLVSPQLLVSPLLLSHCPGVGPHIMPSQRKSSGKQIPGKEDWDHRGGSPRKEHPLRLDSPP